MDNKLLIIMHLWQAYLLTGNKLNTRSVKTSIKPIIYIEFDIVILKVRHPSRTSITAFGTGSVICDDSNNHYINITITKVCRQTVTLHSSHAYQFNLPQMIGASCSSAKLFFFPLPSQLYCVAIEFVISVFIMPHTVSVSVAAPNMLR